MTISIHGTAIDGESLLGIASTDAFNEFVNMGRTNTDGIHADLIAACPLDFEGYGDVFDTCCGIRDVSGVLTQPDAVIIAPSQRI